MQRIYLESNILGNDELILNDVEIFHQLTKVLRSRIGDEIIFFNGKDNFDYYYKISSIDKKNIIFSFIKKEEKFEDGKILNLYQSIPNKIDKIELILQKGVEVGFSNFYFFRSERSQDLNISPNKIERFEKIIIESCEQSGRNKIPQIHFLDKLNLINIKGQNLYFHTNSEKSKKLNEINFENSVNIFVGPEGGFSEKETLNFDDNGFTRINLGNNILRTETVGTAVGFFILQKY